MKEKTNINIEIPSDAQINASSPGTLAIERFKLAMALENKTQLEKEELEDDNNH